MRNGNALIVCVSIFILLAELSAPGQYKFAFPFLDAITDSWRKAPVAYKRSVDFAAELAEEKAKSIANYKGSIQLEGRQRLCGEPIPEKYDGFTKTQLQRFLQSNPIGKSSQKTTQILGEAFCLKNDTTAIYLQKDGSGYLEIAYSSKNPEALPKVQGYAYRPKPTGAVQPRQTSRNPLKSI